MSQSLLVMVKLILCGEPGGAGRTREAVDSLVVVQTANLRGATMQTMSQENLKDHYSILYPYFKISRQQRV